MSVLKFELNKKIPKSAIEICSLIADVTHWSDFSGYGVLPGIERAEYDKRTDDMVGSRIRVVNTDGSRHVEEILEWDAGRKIVIKLHEFSPPLSYLSTHFIEERCFKRIAGDETFVVRKFQMFPTHFITRPFLWLISLLLRKAVAKQLNDVVSLTK